MSGRGVLSRALHSSPLGRRISGTVVDLIGAFTPERFGVVQISGKNVDVNIMLRTYNQPEGGNRAMSALGQADISGPLSRVGLPPESGHESGHGLTSAKCRLATAIPRICAGLHARL